MKNQFWKLDHNRAKRHPPDRSTCTGNHRLHDFCQFYGPFCAEPSPLAPLRAVAAGLQTTILPASPRHLDGVAALVQIFWKFLSFLDDELGTGRVGAKYQDAATQVGENANMSTGKRGRRCS
jgi:hypothetical protein